ncbi:unnamed protein product, partial [Ectocarpus fasciculatus]
MNCRAAGAEEAEAASAVATAVTAAVAVAGRGAARRAGGGGGVAKSGNGDGRGGGAPRAEVPLHLRAVLLYASTQRGIDLRKWFNLGGGGDGETEDEGQAGEKAAALLTRVQFELVLAGLAEGLKAGLSEEERHEIDTAISPRVIEDAVAATSAPAVPADTEAATSGRSSTRSSDGNNNRSMIDVGRLLDLCGIPPTASLPAEAACPETPPPRDRGPQESAGQDVVADVVEEGGPGAPGGRVHDNRGGEAAAQARAVAAAVEAEAEADETALRRVAHQADLYGRMLASLGLKQPVVGSSKGAALADWEASLRVSTVPLEAFRKGLAEVGLQLSRTRALALATRACGPLHSFSGGAIGDDGTGRPRAGRRPNNSTGAGSASLGSSSSGGGGGSSGSRKGTKKCQPRSVDRLSRGGGSRARLRHSSPQRQHQQRQQRGKGGGNQQWRPHEARGRAAARGDGGGGKRAPSLSSRGNGHAHPELSPTTRWRSTPPAPSRAQSSPQRNSPHGEPGIPAWDLRRYLLRLRCESKSTQARCDQRRRRRLRCYPAGQEEGCEDSEGSEEEREGGGGGATGKGGVVEGDEDDAAALSVFAAWGKRIRWERAERDRERKREFQSALAGRPHSLTLEQLLECVHRFEIMPPEVMSRELRAMGKAFSESIEGTRRAREIVRRWSLASPATRNACGTDDPEQQVWEDVQTLSGAQRRSRACAIVAKQREE